MTDELDTLKAVLKSVPPADPAAREAAIAVAMKNFDALQASAAAPRPTQDRPKGAGILRGVSDMLKSLKTGPFLAGTASAAALMAAVVVLLPDWPSLPTRATVAPPEDALTKTAAPETVSPGTAPPVAEPEVVPLVQNADEGRTQTGVARSEADAEVIADGGAAPSRERAAAAPADSATMLAEEAPAADAVAGYAAPESMPLAAPAPAGAMAPDMTMAPVENTEAFSSAPANPVKVTAEEPVSTFSVDVDTASYAVVRNSLNFGQLPPPEAVRIEEMVNYFPYDYPAPAADEAPFRPTVTVMPTPWNPGTRLVHIGLQGRLPAVEARPPLNLVFLIDTSGSMDDPMKLPLLKQSLALMLAELRPEDQVAIVAYAGSAGTVLEPTAAADRARILAALDNLGAGGSTAGAEGLALAYQVATGMAADGEVSRILLATDGDFNVGVDDPAGLESYVARQRESGVYLSVLGFGRGNLDDAVMQSLAQNGNGIAAYIDTLAEARKVLVDQLTGALFPIADDVKIQVEWNPAAVAEYRLIGYETRALAREDFSNDRVDAGEIGAGHQVTAIYEVTAPGSDALRNDPLRYGAPAPDAATAPTELGFLRLRYKEPGADTSALIETPIANATGAASDDARFAAAIAGFGQLLAEPKYLGDWGWDEAVALALGARGEDPYGYRIEAVNLMRMAATLAAR